MMIDPIDMMPNFGILLVVAATAAFLIFPWRKDDDN